MTKKNKKTIEEFRKKYYTFMEGRILIFNGEKVPKYEMNCELIENIEDFILNALAKQRKEIKDIITKKLDKLMANPGEEDDVAIHLLCDILKKL